MQDIQQLITDHINIWTNAESEKKSNRGRSRTNAREIYGIEKLRELILFLAMQGKLTNQNLNDEPVNQLLKNIQLERQKLIAINKAKKETPLIPIHENEKPFKLPINWEWVRLNQIAEANTGYAFKSSEYTSKGTFVLRVTNINKNSTIERTDAKYISNESANSTYKDFLLSKDDILMVMVGGTIGKLGVVNSECLPAVLNQNMWKIVCYEGINKKYLLKALEFVNLTQLKITNSTHGHLSQGDYLSKLIPLPPVSEQLRIVSKVDELMALCDQLEQQHFNSEEAHGKLVKVLLNTLLHSRDAKEFRDSWQRIANHFDTLFSTEDSIDALKQTLLELAVMGKLVSQDPNDEPARDLLKRLQEDKVKNITKASNKKDNLLSTSTDLSPFKLPYTWTYEKLGNLSSLITKGTTPTSLGFAYETNGINFIKVENIKNERINLSSIDQFISPETNNALSRSQLEEGDVLFSIAGTIGKTCIVNKEDLPANTNQALAIIRGTKQIFNQNFLLNQLNSLVSNKVKEKARGGAMNNVSLSDLSELIVVIPPTHEQDRISTKLDELMTLCEELKSRIQQASAKQKQIADVLVSQALH